MGYFLLLLHFLVQETTDDKVMMIPCLIDDTMEAKINDVERDLNNDEEAVCVRYLFDRTNSTIGLYHKFLEMFTRTFLWGENGGEFDVAFSQKVEKRRLGCVGGVQGTIRWITDGIQKAKLFSFLILEYETAFCPAEFGGGNSPKPYSVDRGVRIHLKPQSGQLTKATFEILRKLDEVFSPFVGDTQRSLSCKECQKNKKDGVFFMEEGLSLASSTRPCTWDLQHKPSQRIADLIETSQGDNLFDFNALMTREKSQLGLEPFKSSQMKRDMENGKLEPGHQIWIYHDSETDCWNPVARMNKYAHVVIYVGPKEYPEVTDKSQTVVHKVVHVAKASVTKGLMKAHIKCQEVLRVTKFNQNHRDPVIKYGAIKPNQMVFPGHKIKGCQFAANVRERIAERALRCAKKPSIVFDYDHR